MELDTQQAKGLKQLVQQYKLSFLVLFGSQARRQTHADSDIDIGYHSAGGTLRLQDEAALEAGLAQLLGGTIDLRSLHSENPYFLFSVFKDAQFLTGNQTSFSHFQAYAFQLRHDAVYDLDPIRDAFLRKRLVSL